MIGDNDDEDDDDHHHHDHDDYDDHEDYDHHDDHDVGKDAESFCPSGLKIIVLIVIMMNFSPLGQLARWPIL